MPDADGFSGIARIMAETPTPILVLTANREEAVGFRALSLGALDILEKPSAERRPGRLRRRCSARGSGCSPGVKVIRHLRGLREPPRRRAPADGPGGPGGRSAPRWAARGRWRHLLRGLPPPSPRRIAVVQHIADGFTEGLAGWLAQESRARGARGRATATPLQAGPVLLAPTGRHLRGDAGAWRSSPTRRRWTPSSPR